MSAVKLLPAFLAFFLMSTRTDADFIFGARVGHMTAPQGADDPKLSVAYWPPAEDGSPPSVEVGKEAVVMTDARGRRHLCVLPNTSSVAGSQGAAAEGEEGVQYERGSPPRLGGEGPRRDGGVKVGATRKSPEDLLDAMKELPCFMRMEGWWTYEFCYKKKVRQLHLEAGPGGKAVVMQEFVLGVYQEEASREAQKKYDALFDEADQGGSGDEVPRSQQHPGKRFHVQVYAGGTECDLTGQPRLTEVRFFCEESPQPQHAIESLKEASTCAYELDFITTLLCPHRNFQRVKPQTSVINCYEFPPSEAAAAAHQPGGITPAPGHKDSSVHRVPASQGEQAQAEGHKDAELAVTGEEDGDEDDEEVDSGHLFVDPEIDQIEEALQAL